MITSTWIWHMVGWRWWNIGSSCQTSDTRRRQGWIESVELKWSKSITFWSKRIIVFWKSNTFLVYLCLSAPRHQECTTCIWLTKWIIHCSNPRDFIAPHTTFQCITAGSPCTMVSFRGALPGQLQPLGLGTRLESCNGSVYIVHVLIWVQILSTHAINSSDKH